MKTEAQAGIGPSSGQGLPSGFGRGRAVGFKQLELRSYFLPLVAMRLNLTHDGHGSILESGLGGGHLADGQVAFGNPLADDYGINRRQAGKVGKTSLEVGGHTIGEDHDTGKRLSAKAPTQGAEGLAQAGGGTNKLQVFEIRQIGETSVEPVPLELEIIGQLSLPVLTFCLKGDLQDCSPGTRCAGIGKVEPLAGVGYQGEQVASGLGPFLGDHRIDQAEQQENDPENLQSNANPPGFTIRGGLVIGPQDETNGNDQSKGHGKQPFFSGKVEGFVHGVISKNRGATNTYFPLPSRS